MRQSVINFFLRHSKFRLAYSFYHHLSYLMVDQFQGTFWFPVLLWRTNVTKDINRRGWDLTEGQVWPLMLKTTKNPNSDFKLKDEFDRLKKCINFFFFPTCKLKNQNKTKLRGATERQKCKLFLISGDRSNKTSLAGLLWTSVLFCRSAYCLLL